MLGTVSVKAVINPKWLIKEVSESTEKETGVEIKIVE